MPPFIPESTPIVDTPIFQPQVNKVLPYDSTSSDVVVNAHVPEPQSTYAFRKNRSVKLKPQSNIKINMKNIQKFKSPLQSVPIGKSKTLSLLSKTKNLDSAGFVAQLVMNEKLKWMPTSIPAKVLFDITNSGSVFTLEPQPKPPDPCDVRICEPVKQSGPLRVFSYEFENEVISLVDCGVTTSQDDVEGSCVKSVVSKGFDSSVHDLLRIHRPPIAIFVETRVNPLRTEGIIRRLGFDSFEKVDSHGFSGGIWLLWHSQIVQLQVLSSSDQVINVLIFDTTGFDWVLSAVYAKPSLAGRHVLWNFLDGCGFYASHPWLLLGDFNDTVSAEESSNPLVVNRSNHFLSWINRNCLIDLSFYGPKFTWTNGRKGKALNRKRLDRGLCNSDWRVHFKEAFSQHLPRTRSDHYPVLLNVSGIAPSTAFNKPFRFEACWLSHLQFSDMVKNFWGSSSELLPGLLDSFASNLKIWNNDVFGNIFLRKRRILARLKGIQKALCLNSNPYFSNL
ncbi:reverse transcriptase [Quillaja saponaria]|uniref:Reverse transcriptase n=1 Tax=Quillaja saponaria TaxID=32244 RepID=A0AAD7L3H0_QUISA|nr:reverse transcriptase [Quillaja saponaria]